ncbi:BnaA06g20890D [Brassica napus]|uniref:BnaA06g20890D protein n=1 Tax=Brassica napus TaxID=3708 RepID=A0A078G5T5_BRANA|nr:BnaA06g20890D [Brassica napus]
MHRFLRNQSCLRAIPRLTPSLIPHQKPCIVDYGLCF